MTCAQSRATAPGTSLPLPVAAAPAWASIMVSSQAHTTGLTLIFTVAVIWIAASFVVQSIEGELHPFLLSFFCNLLFLIYLPLSFWKEQSGCVHCLFTPP